MQASPSRRVTAVLGPTNTGKTFLAIERMLGHRSGMIGFPLRLLARENYDRIVRLKGARAVALITGEEKIVPPNPSWFVCTVESMPLDRRVSFLAVDEIQLAADPERGHIFTQRLLHARGEDETMFLGSDTIRPLIRRLVPEAEYLSRPRFSTLTYTGEKKVTRLPPRTAVVAFSAAEVYALAELVRRQRGGTAVVMGALSPRTRNAQVAMYQGGEVDYMVATDAIGMGLNMDLDHVAFARLDKFDGRYNRRLNASEVAQIAGRAGRHMSDGSFGTTTEVGPLDPELVEAVENHRFDPIRTAFWRNADLDFRSPPLLLRSLERRPDVPWLHRAREADDQMALAALSHDHEIAARAGHPQGLRLLWEVCQIPDFRKVMTDAHTRLLGQIFRQLTRPVPGGGITPLPDDWVAGQMARIDRPQGDIDTLMARIAHVRTWTYISHRPDWLGDPAHWQERARDIEDRLSDALHESLTQRFVDRRHAVLVRKMKDGGELLAAVTRAGEVVVEGHPVGRVEGFRFMPEDGGDADGTRALMSAARRALAQDTPGRLLALERDGDDAFALAPQGLVLWQGVPVARLTRGDSALAPQVEPLASDLLDNAARERVRRRLADWLRQHLGRRLAPLVRLQTAPVAGAARGLAFQLVEALGCLPRRAAGDQLRALTPLDRKALAQLGLRLGAESVWLPTVFKGDRPALLALLRALHDGVAPPALPRERPAVLPAEHGFSDAMLAATGYRRLRECAVRVDTLEWLSLAARRRARQGPFAADAALAAALGGSADDLPPLLRSLGYRQEDEGGAWVARAGSAGRRRADKSKAKRPRKGGDSPFAGLGDLYSAK